MQVKNKNSSKEQKNRRKQEILTHPSPSVTRKISDALVIKDGNIFFVCLEGGDVPLETGHAFGLYYKDCRFLCGYELRLSGHKPSLLISNDDRGYGAALELTNTGFKENNERILKDTIGIRWERMLDGRRRLLKDTILFHNYGEEDLAINLSLSFDADFKDIFLIRQLLKKKQGKKHAPRWQNHALCFSYEGKDNVFRTTRIEFWPAPVRTHETCAEFPINLKPGQETEFSICILIAQSQKPEEAKDETTSHPDAHRKYIDLEPSFQEWKRKHADIETDSLLLNNLFHRSMRDLRILRSSIDKESFFAAGIPWFATLFGRDSIITSIQTLAFNPDIANETLRLLASYQGRRFDDWKDEQPGGILHELRVGELAGTGAIPHTPYYGTIDATPLFLVLLGLYLQWTGDVQLAQDIKENVDLAVEWIFQQGNSNGNGYLSYNSTSKKGLVNQGWKDSGNAIVNHRGSIARPPIALAEVQSYAFFAETLIADFYSDNRGNDYAAQLRRKSDALHAAFNRDFWSDELGCYVLALQADNEPAKVVASNAGHVLWGGIATEEKAKRTVNRLMQEDVFSGWGIRTLSQNEICYNPVGYHLGTVWPHDNSIIAAGFRRYGHDEEAYQIISGILHAAMHFKSYRLPEVFAGFSRKDFPVPVHYPVACHPQAWAAASVPYMLTTLLGIHPNAFDKALRIVRPTLPQFANQLTLYGMRVGDASVDIHFERGKKDIYAKADVMKVSGKLEVKIES